MRKNSLGKRIAALTAAVILTTAMAVPAFAADPTAPANPASNDTGITTIGFQKTVAADKDTYQPGLTFTFEVKSGTSTTYLGQDVYPGTVSDAQEVTIDNVKTDPSQKGDMTYTSNIRFTSPIVYEQPGIYHYQVKESATAAGINDNAHTVYDQTTKDLYVYVKRNKSNALVIYGAVLVGADGVKTDMFTNIYKYNDKQKDDFKNLTIKKEVSGPQGDTNKEFTFYVNITNSVDGRKSYNAVKPDGTVVTLAVGTPYSFTLKDGETFTVDNLAAGDKYTVSEDTAANYVTTATLKNSASDATSYKLANETTMNDYQNDVIVTNKRDAATPTGIVMNIAPYVLMLLGALCAAFVFFRKKKVEE